MNETRNYYRKIIRSRGFKGEACEVLVHKVMLITEIKALIEKNGWSQTEAAKKLKVAKPRVAELNRMCIDKFSTDLLIRYLYRLNCIVDIGVSLQPAKQSPDASLAAPP